MSGIRPASYVSALGAVAWVGVVVLVTLQSLPFDPGFGRPVGHSCLICGERGAADAVLNVAFFVPLGAFVFAAWRRLGLAIGVGFVLTVLVEFGQSTLPGRYATLGDVVWNTTGAVLGALLVLQWPRLYALVFDDRTGVRARTAGAVWPGVLTAWLALSGLLLVNLDTPADYWGQHTPDLSMMPRYGGSVVDARLDDMPLPSRRLEDSDRARSILDGDWSLEATIRVGDPPRAVSPIVSIYDRRRREILLLGADRRDAVLRERTLADRLAFDRPDIRVEGAWGSWNAGETVRIGARRDGDARCLSIGPEEWCDLGVTPGRSWAFLLYPGRLTEPVRRRVDAVWIFMLFVPLGLASRSVALAGAGVAGVTAAGAVSAALTPLTALSPAEAVAALLAVATGLLLRRIEREISARR